MSLAAKQSPSPETKLERLKEILKDYGRVLVAFSGGVDSTFLLKIAADVLRENCHAITCVSPTMAAREQTAARELGELLGLGSRHHMIRSNELAREEFRKNPKDRCAHCKFELMDMAIPVAQEYNIDSILLGTNHDDLGDYRPGIQAASSKGALAPMVEASLTKDDIRALSKAANLPTWDKPQLACLSSRFPYGTEIDEQKLSQVDKLEQFIGDLGFTQLRVRYHGDVARIELPADELHRAASPEIRAQIVSAARDCGFVFAALDLSGFKSGSLNQLVTLTRRSD